MFRSIEGVYHDGRIELVEAPSNVSDDTYVIVTFLESKSLDLQARGISETHAAELRARLKTFVEDWESPEMDIYDNYDASRASL